MFVEISGALVCSDGYKLVMGVMMHEHYLHPMNERHEFDEALHT